MKITIHDPVFSSVPLQDLRFIHPILSHQAVFYVKRQYRKERRTYQKPVYTKINNKLVFHTGLVDRILNKFPDADLEINYTMDFPLCIPEVKGIVFRPDQLHLINQFMISKRKRGVIVAPTATGKTILQIGIVSTLPSHYKILILAHTISLVRQLHGEFSTYFQSVQYIDGTTKMFPDSRIVISTIQTYRNLVEVYNSYDAVIIDEVHHVASPTYVSTLESIPAPIRLGFTATLPDDPEKILKIEGILGPIIGEQTVNEAAELEIIAKPRIRIIKLPKNEQLAKITRYPDVYHAGITANVERNLRIVSLIHEYSLQRKTVLVLVTHLEHGQNLFNLCYQNGIVAEYVHGNTESETREQVKKLLISKSLDAVIVTSVWREGINIPTLDVIINAGGGKGEIPTLQAIGRGLRKAAGKDEVVIVDFFDPSHRYLVEHFGHRISLYCDNNWL